MTDSNLLPQADAEGVNWVKYAGLLLQLAAIAWVVHYFQIESAAFFHLTILLAVGFATHYLLPLRHRLPFFLLLSLSGIALVLGMAQAAWLIALGLGLIGIAHLPLNIRTRVLMLLGAGAVLFLHRAARLDVPWSDAVWPILGSMFMFRMIVYMYDMATGQGQASIAQRLSYFFLLPNVCFPLFPVVDFRTYVRTYYAGPRHENYQVGVDWIVRGIVQLLVYRFVQLSLMISPYDVENAFNLAHYFVWLYLLYLRISGQFHLVVGILRLFGFGLPETHHRYYLASSFTDFWRRINIYWKDFMMKIFYYPMFFRLRRFGSTTALVVSTVCVFFLTWALHAYQGFWIRGFFPFTWNDALFWTTLCGLVVAGSLYEARYGRRRTLARSSSNPRGAVLAGVKTVGTFAAMCVLWSFWSTESLSSWFSLWPAAAVPPTRHQLDVLFSLAAAAGLIVAAWLALRSWAAGQPQRILAVRHGTTTGWLVILCTLSAPGVIGSLGTSGTVLAAIVSPRLNGNQLGELERGYYEDLLTVDRFNPELAALYDKRPAEWALKLTDLGAAKPGAEPGEELLPNVEVVFRGAPFRTNRWGMHDKDYTQEPLPGTFRIALIGASHSLGYGVERHETYEAVLEDRLNREQPVPGFDRYEILNFSFNQYMAFDQIRLLETKVGAFKPQALFAVGHPYELRRVLGSLRASLQRHAAGAPAPLIHRFPWIEELGARAGVQAGTSPYLAERRLARFGDEIFLRLFGTIVTLSREQQIASVYVHMPLTPESRNEVDNTAYVDLAREAGFVTIDLTGAYDGHDRQAIWIAEWDAHPNALGHRLVANRLYELILQKRDTIFVTYESTLNQSR